MSYPGECEVCGDELDVHSESYCNACMQDQDGLEDDFGLLCEECDAEMDGADCLECGWHDESQERA